jgi:hypothetical protein
MDRWIYGWFDGCMVVRMNGWVVSISETKLVWARLD